MKIAGLYNWHDGGYCILEDGKILEHIEFERYNRVKASGGDSLKYLQDIYLKNNNLNMADIDVWVSPCPNTNLEKGGGIDYDTHDKLPKAKINFYSHHLCHAAHSFYSSNYENSLIITIDSAGLEKDNKEISTGLYIGNKNKIHKISDISSNIFSLGNLWTKCVRFIFKLSAGHPRGHQAGSVMAMAAFGNPDKYYNDFMNMATKDFHQILVPPKGMIRGWVEPENDVTHPYLDKYRKIASAFEVEKFNMAASLQKVTETFVFDIVSQSLKHAQSNNLNIKNICFSGGVSLNSVMTGKILERFPGIENVFIPPVPYDGGLNIGACQYHWYHILGNNRKQKEFVTPFLGQAYEKDEIESAIKDNKEKLLIKNNVTIDEITDLLCKNKIISIFQGRSESGRRALGNRSIIASPKDTSMKSLINDKVKHRQWYRPFAPSILHEYGSEWFENYFESPYMGFVFKIKKDKLKKAPAIEHKDGTARIQSVTQQNNKNYYEIIKSFKNKSGIPMVLNTSFNDREPIVETPNNAINCFLNTNIDFLYFADYNILLTQNKK
jgi:carbamoyltransferase